MKEQWEKNVWYLFWLHFPLIYISALSHLWSYLGKQEVHDSSCPVKNILSCLCQSDQTLLHIAWCILSHSCALLQDRGIAWRHGLEPLDCCTAPLEKKGHFYSSEQCTILCISRKLVLFSGSPYIIFCNPPVHVGVGLLHCPEAWQVSVLSPVR